MKREISEFHEIQRPGAIPYVEPEREKEAEQIFKEIFSKPLGEWIAKQMPDGKPLQEGKQIAKLQEKTPDDKASQEKDSSDSELKGGPTEFDKKAQEHPEDNEYDDNGNLYKNGKELKPNNTYEVNGYTYKTDDKGRIISAEGKLQPKDHKGKKPINDSMKDIGKGDQKDTDERGHLIGDQFNGSPNLDNLVPQDSKLNQGEVKKLENSLAKAVEGGSEVYLKVEPVYSDNSARPVSFTYTYTVDGEKSVKVFKNGE